MNNSRCLKNNDYCHLNQLHSKSSPIWISKSFMIEKFTKVLIVSNRFFKVFESESLFSDSDFESSFVMLQTNLVTVWRLRGGFNCLSRAKFKNFISRFFQYNLNKKLNDEVEFKQFKNAILFFQILLISSVLWKGLFFFELRRF